MKIYPVGGWWCLVSALVFVAPEGCAEASSSGLLTAGSDASLQRGAVIESGTRISVSESDSAIVAAAADLAADLGRVLGTPGEIVRGTTAPIVLSLETRLGGQESWRITIASGQVVIAGGDTLGLVHGIYAFSEKFLGVDPLWFWKDVPAERRERIELAAQTIISKPAKFRYRGWFINDEDLLTEFGTSGGPRHIDYPFYHQVIDYAMAERIFEALLRLGGNLIIPASFVDILNPAEAELVRRGAARGLYVSQHHVEPMGVSHFGYENYWRALGEKKSFRYSVDPDAVREVWRAHAKKWREVAGDQVIWQLGMRGRGDRPIWVDDPNITRATGGDFISRAIADQAIIVREVDPRPNPPMTSTLFMEGADLMASGELRFPAGLTVIFADYGASQEMQRDFFSTPRLPDYRYGFYYHVAFWRRGPHLIQGVGPERIQRAFEQVEEKGDTNYAIVNVANVREHVLGAHTFIRTAWHGAQRSLGDTLAEFAPAETIPFMRAFFAALVQRKDGVWIQDGDCAEAAEVYLGAPDRAPAMTASERLAFAEQLTVAATALEAMSGASSLSCVPDRWRAWTHQYYLIQGEYLGSLYRMKAALIHDDPSAAIRHLERSLAIRAPLATGRWTGWYVGEKKANWASILERLRRHPSITSP